MEMVFTGLDVPAGVARKAELRRGGLQSDGWGACAGDRDRGDGRDGAGSGHGEGGEFRPGHGGGELDLDVAIAAGLTGPPQAGMSVGMTSAKSLLPESVKAGPSWTCPAFWTCTVRIALELPTRTDPRSS